MQTLQELFMPQGQKFYKLFDEVAENLKKVSVAFHAALQTNGDGSFETHLNRLDALEKANDIVTHRLFVELGRNFITPFDREDIHSLISGLDDIADVAYGIARQMKSYAITNTGNSSVYVAAEFKRYIDFLVLAINGLKNKRSLSGLNNLCLEMKKIIMVCDSRIDAAITGLFPVEKDPVQIIKWMEHFDFMHGLLEKCENAVNVIESIIIKYS